MNKKILICDDEPHILESICYVVGKEGYKYITAENGNDAYQCALDDKPDLVILDVGMPGMTGLQVCQKIRETPQIKNMIILVLTAFGQASDETHAYEAGANYFMTKPFSPRQLREKLCEIFI